MEETDAQIIERLTAVVGDCYIAGHCCGPDYKEIAPYAIKRWRSSKRRGVPQDDQKRRIYDLAKGLASIGLQRRATVLPSHEVVAAAIAKCLTEDSLRT
jgi:hypothetical protein